MKIKGTVPRKKDSMKSEGMAARGQVIGISRLKILVEVGAMMLVLLPICTTLSAS